MANENGIGRPTNAQIAEKKRELQNISIEAMGDGWPLFISICRWFPDFLLDLIRDEDEADYELSFIQRIILRVNARYQYCDIQGSRSLTKSFCEIVLNLEEGVLWPGLRTAYYGPSQKQTAGIAGEKWNIISKNYPILTKHYDVAIGKDSFIAKSAYGSVLSITAQRGNDFHQTIAEEYAQEENPRFDHAEYAAVVKKAIRGFPVYRGRKDRTFIPYKQRSITSAGRRQNPAYEIRARHEVLMNRGESAYIMDVPFDVILLCLMRGPDWAIMQKEDCTPELWAREMETRNTGSDQNPVVRDEVLSSARQLLLMEEHHCCRDYDNKLRPEDVIYVVAYDVSYADGPQTAKCAAAVVKLTRQTYFFIRDKYLKQIVWLQAWRPADQMMEAKRLNTKLDFGSIKPGDQKIELPGNLIKKEFTENEKQYKFAGILVAGHYLEGDNSGFQVLLKDKLIVDTMPLYGSAEDKAWLEPFAGGFYAGYVEDTSVTGEGNSKNPGTGDNSDLVMWLVILLFCVGGLAILSVTGRKKRKK